VAAGAGVVVVQARDRVEEELVAEFGQPGIELAPEPGLERRGDPAGEAVALQFGGQRRCRRAQPLAAELLFPRHAPTRSLPAPAEPPRPSR